MNVRGAAMMTVNVETNCIVTMMTSIFHDIICGILQLGIILHQMRYTCNNLELGPFMLHRGDSIVEQRPLSAQGAWNPMKIQGLKQIG